MNNRIFSSADYEKPQEGEPFRSVVTMTDDSSIIVWHVKPGQNIHSHIHPNGQDTWIVMSGSAEYIFDESGETKTVKTGDIVIAERGQIHGAVNNGDIPFVFVSVVSPAIAGFELKS